jgi:hypothetical protein
MLIAKAEKSDYLLVKFGVAIKDALRVSFY